MLLVSQRPLSYGGGGSVRWNYLARALPELGWEVHMVTARPNPTANETSADPVEARLAAARARVMGTVGRGVRPLAHALGVEPEAFAPNLVWAMTGRGAVRRAIRRVRPDVVWATSPPVSGLLAAAAVAPGAGLPLVGELRDLWAANPFYDVDGRLLTRIEAPALRRCDAVVSVTDGCRDRLLALHPDLAERFELIPNGFDPVLLERRRPTPAHDGPAVLLHAGTLYGDRTAEPLVRVLRRPELAGRARLVLLGAAGGPDQRLAGPDVEVAPPVGRDEAIGRLLAADVAVVINGPATGGDMALPSKLFEALAVGRPVVALTSPGSDTARLLERLGQGQGIAAPRDDDAIAAALTRVLDAPPAPVETAAILPWSRAESARRVAALLDRLAAV